MRLNSLSLCAFGPYKKEQTIDFNLINDRKLFLVTGPTGAGKTTIFDAISYALFGNASGSSRDADSFRSDFASSEDETYVSLEFELKGNKYYVRRSPKQERKKVKGFGTTIKSADAILEIVNGKTFTGVLEVNQQLQIILGIDHHQFRQIVMLPQGEFRQLLEASSQDREAIFRKIFKTEDYLMIQDILKQKTSQLKLDIGDVYKLLDNHVNHIQYEPNDELEPCIKATYKDYDNILFLLDKKIEFDEDCLDKLVKEIELKEKEIFQLSSEIEKGQSINEKFIREQELKSQKQVLSERIDEIKDNEVKIKKAQNAQVVYQIEEQVRNLEQSIKTFKEEKGKVLENESDTKKIIAELNEQLKETEEALNEIEVLNESVFILKDKLIKYQKYDEKLEDLNQTKKEIEIIDKKMVDMNATMNRLNGLIASKQESLTTYKGIDKELSEYKIQYDSLKYQMKNHNLQLSVLNDLIKLNEKHQKLSEQYQQRNLDYKNNKQLYEEKLDHYLLGQAGLLAVDLKNNEPCPVCGSTIHPNKASICEDMPTTDELDVLKTVVENKEKVMGECYSQVFSVNNTIIDKKNLYEQLIGVGKDEFVVNDEIDDLKKLIVNEKSQFEEIEKIISSLMDKLSKKETLDLQIVNDIKLLGEKEIVFDKLKETFIDLDTLYHVKLDKIKELEESIIKDYPNKVILENEIKLLEQKIKNIKESYQNMLTKKEEKNNQLLILQTNLKNLCDNINLNEESLKTEIKKLQDKLVDHGFSNLDDYRSFLLNEEELIKLEKEVRSFYDELSFVDKTLIQLKLELKNLHMVDVLGLTEKQKSVKDSCGLLRNVEKSLHFTIQNNIKILKEMKALHKKVGQQLETFEVISDLSKAANGDNPQKMTFERYVLAAYFDEIIYAANIRLSEMTNNRYFLCRKEEKGKGSAQQGLDLEVVDNYTSKNRLVKTLSGGESFIASLSLALGLADVVQSYSGGIQLDTIFIDEGFGSLDPESLEQAISTLVSIQKSGRLVGIISHVQELKERIDVKLEITPSQLGSTAQFVF